jgi:hypothetical protein
MRLVGTSLKYPKQRNFEGRRSVFEAVDVGEVDKGEGTCEWEVVMRVYFSLHDVSEAEESC